MRPHRRQPTRLPHPWDSPGKNTGVGCHFLLQRMKVKSESEIAQSCPTLSDPMDFSLPGSSVHGIFQARVLEWGATAFSNWQKCPNSTSRSKEKVAGCTPVDLTGSWSSSARPKASFRSTKEKRTLVTRAKQGRNSEDPQTNGFRSC